MEKQQGVSSDDRMEAKLTYQYPIWMDLANKATGIFMVFLGIGSLLSICWSLTTVGSWQQFSEWVRNTWGIFIWSLLWLIGAGVLIHICPEITIGPAGLETTVLFGIPVRIPWDEILALRETPMFPGRRNVRVILVKRLTPWHRVISLTCCLDPRPGLIIADRMEGYHALVKIIETHLTNRSK